MSAPVGLITVVQFGGYWFGIKAKDKTMITHALSNKDVARIAAQRFAQENRLPYQDDALIFQNSVVTIRKYLGSWLPAIISPQDIKDAGVTTEDKKEAIEWAQEIAEIQNLEFLPFLGESAFPNNT